MNKKYKIISAIYSLMLLFSILFTLVMIGASGHGLRLSYQNYFFGIFVLCHIALLIILPRIPKKMKRLNIVCGILSLLFLLICVSFSIVYMFKILSENLIIEFKVISSLFISTLVALIVYLFIQVLYETKRNLFS
jgi:membrane protease YdiL (CAAX protease family)